MFRFTALNISIDVHPENEVHNRDLVGYVIQKYPRKVVKGTILTRQSIESWYSDSVAKYPDDRFTLLIGTVSLVGEVHGTTELRSKDGNVVTPYHGGPTGDPSAN